MTAVILGIYIIGVIIAGYILYKEYGKHKSNAYSQAGMIVVGSALSWATVVVWFITKFKSA